MGSGIFEKKPGLWPLRTGQSHAPWAWAFLLSGPWAAKLYFEQISSVAVTFKLRAFTDLPALITAVGSFNLVFSIFVGASCNYASDRVWTRWGRRKPFLILGWTTIAVGCLILPEITTLAGLVVMLFFYELLRDVDAPFESLINEVVPPKQRGRAQAILTFMREATKVLFFAVLIGQWDAAYQLPLFGPVSGHHVVFWSGTLIALGATAFIGWGVKETPPASPPPPPPRVTVMVARKMMREFLHNVFGEHQWRAIYAVAFAQMFFWIGFGNLTPLLFTDEWGFSKQTYGNIIALGSPFVLLVCLPLSGWLTDRIDRLNLFKILTVSLTLCHAIFYLYLKLRSDNGAPSLAAVSTYWLSYTGIGSIGTVCTVSMMFDFVPRDRLGTVSSGIGITRGVATILFNNGIGIWIMTWSSRFGAADRYDYESGFIYLIFCGVIACGVAFWFARQVDTGRLIKLGVLEADNVENQRPP